MVTRESFEKMNDLDRRNRALLANGVINWNTMNTIRSQIKRGEYTAAERSISKLERRKR